MPYAVKEIYYTLQGEGVHAGRGAVFLRFSGCNLWNGLERDRASAVCTFCDTDFVGVDGPRGGKYAGPSELASAVESAWNDSVRESPESGQARFVVCTGGEPMLQIDEALIDGLHERGFEIAIETNGTIDVPRSIDWICVSPKAGAVLVQRSGDELKLVYPQVGFPPSEFDGLPFDNFSLQPMDGPDREANTRLALDYCTANPRWRLSLQLHKILAIP